MDCVNEVLRGLFRYLKRKPMLWITVRMFSGRHQLVNVGQMVAGASREEVHHNESAGNQGW